MTKELNLARIAVVLLFALTFTFIGWTAPMIYASYAPQSQIMEVQEFSAQDTSVSADQHYVCFDRTSHRGASGRIFTELYLVDGDNDPVEVDSNSIRQYFQKGDERIITSFELPQNLRAGEYKYILVIQMELADGRVTRNFEYESNTFTINETPVNGSRKAGC